MPLDWIDTTGGPLILMPVCLRSAWRGTLAPADGADVRAAFRWNPSGPATDYDRACEVQELADVINVGAGTALVFGDEPALTAWLPADGGGVIARWRYAPGKDEAEAALASLPDFLAWKPLCRFRVADSPLVLFDAAEAGDETLSPRLHVELARGDYDVAEAIFAASDEAAFVLIRLRRVGDLP